MITLFGVTLSPYVWMVLGAILGYCIGTIPTGLIVGKLFFKKDIRAEGSGNIGATNAIRALGKLPGFLVLVIDMVKAFILPYYLFVHLPWGDSEVGFKSGMGLMEILGEMIKQIFSNIATIQYSAFIIGVSSFFILLGNCFNGFLKFKGGKGVATTYGVFFALQPAATVFAAITYGFVFFLTKTSALGSLISLFFLPIYIFLISLYSDTEISNFLAGLAAVFYVIVFVKHWPNIKKLVSKQN